jgi:hypothetical protein
MLTVEAMPNVPDALLDAMLLPTRDGYLAILDMRKPNVACPTCGAAMGLVIIRQVEDERHRLRWVYSCISCAPKVAA